MATVSSQALTGVNVLHWPVNSSECNQIEHYKGLLNVRTLNIRKIATNFAKKCLTGQKCKLDFILIN